MSEEKNNKRSLYWTFILYPESAPSDWREILNTMGLSYIVSPLHDADFNPDGTKKKEHYHITLVFGSVKAYHQVKEITDKLNCPIPQIVHNMRGVVRYKAHLDNPEKAQYRVDDIEAVGVDLDKFLYSASEEKERRLKAIKDMIFFIKEQDLSEFTHILEWSSLNEPYWFELLCSNSAYVINCYLKSRRYELEKSHKGLK